MTEVMATVGQATGWTADPGLPDRERDPVHRAGFATACAARGGAR